MEGQMTDKKPLPISSSGLDKTVFGWY